MSGRRILIIIALVIPTFVLGQSEVKWTNLNKIKKLRDRRPIGSTETHFFCYGIYWKNQPSGAYKADVIRKYKINGDDEYDEILLEIPRIENTFPNAKDCQYVNGKIVALVYYGLKCKYMYLLTFDLNGKLLKDPTKLFQLDDQFSVNYKYENDAKAWLIENKKGQTPPVMVTISGKTIDFSNVVNAPMNLSAFDDVQNCYTVNFDDDFYLTKIDVEGNIAWRRKIPYLLESLNQGLTKKTYEDNDIIRDMVNNYLKADQIMMKVGNEGVHLTTFTERIDTDDLFLIRGTVYLKFDKSTGKIVSSSHQNLSPTVSKKFYEKGYQKYMKEYLSKGFPYRAYWGIESVLFENRMISVYEEYYRTEYKYKNSSDVLRTIETGHFDELLIVETVFGDSIHQNLYRLPKNQTDKNGFDQLSVDVESLENGDVLIRFNDVKENVKFLEENPNRSVAVFNKPSESYLFEARLSSKSEFTKSLVDPTGEQMVWPNSKVKVDGGYMYITDLSKKGFKIGYKKK